MTQVLDHGYVEYVDHWGSDEAIVEAARMSVKGGFVSWTPYEAHKDGDAGLLRHLWRSKHSSPFEFAGLIVEVKAPIVVFREWHRHRTMSYAEMSARYTPLPNENYVPSVERYMMAADKANKQAGTIAGAEPMTRKVAESEISNLKFIYEDAQLAYEAALRSGVPKELARLRLPVARYSRMRASANLLNWTKFLTLRTAPDAMWEIRQYAEAVSSEIQRLFPRVHELWADKL